ncbi:hypothetical protein WDW89_09345 [Deltaproteobacteria bacterium TL4]
MNKDKSNIQSAFILILINGILYMLSSNSPKMLYTAPIFSGATPKTPETLKQSGVP